MKNLTLKLSFIALLFCMNISVFAQSRYTVNFYVEEEKVYYAIERGGGRSYLASEPFRTTTKSFTVSAEDESEAIDKATKLCGNFCEGETGCRTTSYDGQNAEACIRRNYSLDGIQ